MTAHRKPEAGIGRRSFITGLSLMATGACAPAGAIPSPAHVPLRGAERPQLVVQEIGDYECPFCAEVQPAVKRLMAEMGERIALAWRNYPLDRHPHAYHAAEAALEARAQLGDDGFWKYHDVLFANQSKLGPEDLLRFAEAFAIDRTRFARALELRIHRDEVLSDKLEIARLKLPGFGTPAFIIGSDVFVGVYSFEDLRSFVERAL
ncbi:MAG: DsbA family protein [Myxococcales bacterium]|nr:DsbA family protein [Myxococcales bacterium]